MNLIVQNFLRHDLCEFLSHGALTRDWTQIPFGVGRDYTKVTRNVTLLQQTISAPPKHFRRLISRPTEQMSPLANLIQSIHLPSHRFLLLTHPSAQSPTKIELRLFAYPPSSRPPSPTAISENGTGNDTGLLLWVGEMDLEEEDGEVSVDMGWFWFGLHEVLSGGWKG